MQDSSIQKGQVAVVTGASAGVGRAIALDLARRGYRLGLISRDGAALTRLAQQIADEGGEALALPADVADVEAVEHAARAAVERFGRLDVWVNDAMETVFSFFEDMTHEEFTRVTEVTYLGFVHGTRAALRQMRRRDRGTIVQIGSALAYRGIPLQSAYCGAKHAIKGFTESLRTELMHQGSGIRLTMIDLPAVNTPQFDWARAHLDRKPRPMGKPVQPEVVARAVHSAILGSAPEYFLGRSTLLTVMGNEVLPGVMDRLLATKAVEGQMRQERLGSRNGGNLAHPVPEHEHMHGSFSAEAAHGAMMLRADVARAGVVTLGALGFLALGIVLGGLTTGRSPRLIR